MSKKLFILLADYVRTHNVAAKINGGISPFNDEHFKTLCAFMLATNERFNRAIWLAYVKGDK